METTLLHNDTRNIGGLSGRTAICLLGYCNQERYRTSLVEWICVNQVRKKKVSLLSCVGISRPCVICLYPVWTFPNCVLYETKKFIELGKTLGLEGAETGSWVPCICAETRRLRRSVERKNERRTQKRRRERREIEDSRRRESRET